MHSHATVSEQSLRAAEANLSNRAVPISTTTATTRLERRITPPLPLAYSTSSMYLQSSKKLSQHTIGEENDECPGAYDTRPGGFSERRISSANVLLSSESIGNLTYVSNEADSIDEELGETNNSSNNDDFVMSQIPVDDTKLPLEEEEEEEEASAKPTALQRKMSMDTKLRFVSKVVVIMCLIILISILVSFCVTFDMSKNHKNTMGLDDANNETQVLSRTTITLMMKDILPEYTLQAIEKNNSTSPQAKALSWITSDPNINLYNDSRKLTRFALATFYYATGGETNWRRKTNWLSTDPQMADESQWYGCSNQNCENLILESNFLVGSIPKEFGLLTSLRYVDLRGRFGSRYGGLSGSIPSQIASLTRLEYLNVGSNALTGDLPSEVGNMTSLQLLHVEGNNLNGSLPTEIGLLSQLQYFHMDSNSLKGSIPSFIGLLNKLKSLRMDHNYFTGAIPSEVEHLTSLKRLDLSRNMLNGTIPSQIGYLTQLEFLLSVSSNSLTGSIPSQIGNLTSLQSLHINGNSLTGTLPKELGNLASLQVLEVKRNNLNGTIPLQIGSLTQLNSLKMDKNSFTGPIPPTMGNLTNLQYLVVSDNFLTGTVPESVLNLPRPDFFMEYCPNDFTAPAC